MQKIALKPYFHPELLFYANGLPVEHQARLDNIRQKFCSISEQLIFFEFELVLSLYQQYQQQRGPFVESYLKRLEAGGSAPLQGLLAPFGVDLSTPNFWQQDYDLLAEMIAEMKGSSSF